MSSASSSPDVEVTVGEFPRFANDARAGDGECRWIARHFVGTVRANDRHCDAAISGEDVLGHLAITRFEDVQRRGGVRKEYDVREGESRQAALRSAHARDDTMAVAKPLALDVSLLRGMIGCGTWIDARFAT
jgi:hypothetical protein